MTTPERWPGLKVDSWTDTQETLQMWLQIVGKIQLVSTPLLNHWWNVTYEVSARGLRTRLMWGPRSQFDAEDTTHHSYDAAAVQTWWRQLFCVRARFPAVAPWLCGEGLARPVLLGLDGPLLRPVLRPRGTRP